MSGIQQLATKDQTILHAMDGMLRGAYRNDPYSFPGIKTFGATRPKYFALEVSKNSPLTPISLIGVLKIFERGTYDRLSVMWQGPPITYSGEVELMVLTAGQTFLVFGILAFLLILSVTLLLLEICFYQFSRVTPDNFSV